MTNKKWMNNVGFHAFSVTPLQHTRLYGYILHIYIWDTCRESVLIFVPQLSRSLFGRAIHSFV